MTLTVTLWITHVKQFQASMDAASCRQDGLHGCRHPPPSARRNQFRTSKLESMSWRTVATLGLSLLKIGSMWLYVTPARKSSYLCRRSPGLRCLSLSGRHWLSVEAKQ